MSVLDPQVPPCHFLQLSPDLRNRIYELIFFAREKKKAWGLDQAMTVFESRKLNWASTGMVGTTINQIHPYRRDSKHQPQYDLSVLRTNRQIQEEAERVFYGWSSFNLTTDAYAPGEFPTFQFFQTLPSKYRKLVRRVELRCFHEAAHQPLPGNPRLTYLFDWNAFMRFLALECPSLYSLVLWGFADGPEGEELGRNCHMGSDWVQSILQIPTLRHFDIRAIPRRRITEGQSCVPKVLEDLRRILYASSSLPTESAIPVRHSGFPLMRLPLHIRKRVYRFALLPPNKKIHPYLKSWYDVTTRNVVPLFLTCRQIQEEAEAVLYGEGFFCAPATKYDQALTTCLAKLPPRLRYQIKHTALYWQLVSPFLVHAVANQHLFTFDYRHRVNDSSIYQRYVFVADLLHKPWPLKRITIETNDSMKLSRLIRDWIIQGFIDLGLFDPGHLILRLDRR
jgi:hypothetical protein